MPVTVLMSRHRTDDRTDAMMVPMPRTRVLTPLRWSDMDAYGHVNNVQFLRLLEDARVVAFAAHGSDEGGSVVETGLLVARQQIEYLEPLLYRPAPVAIDLWLTDLQTASFDLGYEVLDDDCVYARAETTLVLFDRVNDRPRRMTPSERGRLEALRDQPVRWRHRRSRG
jgi:acyl-CoA thioester hydrolase